MQNNNAKFKIFSIRKKYFSLFAFRFKFNSGFGLIEILIASAILSASLIALSATNQIAFRLMKESLEKTQASFLTEEAIEVVRILRDDSWSENIASLVSGVAYYPSFDIATVWTLQEAETPFLYDTFQRTVVLSDVYRRNSDGEIVDEASFDPKTIDPDAKQITARVFWSASRETVIETYITNIFQN